MGGCRSLRREPAAQGLSVRSFEPRVRPEWGPPRCSGSVNRCQDWQARRRCSWLLAVSPCSPRPLSFFPPPFPTTPAAAASKCKKCQGDFPAIGEGVTTFTALGLFLRSSPAPLTSTRASPNCEKKNPSPAEN